MKFYPYKKGGGKSFSHAEGGGGGRGTTSFEVVLTQELEVLAKVMGGGDASFHPLKGGCKKFNPVLGGGGLKKLYLYYVIVTCDGEIRQKT